MTGLSRMPGPTSSKMTRGIETFRLVALSRVADRPTSEQQEEFERQVIEKDTQLRELQHRVKNNLQMVTALIRLEARNLPDPATGERFDKLAGRVEALALLYRTLSAEGSQDTVDLGVYVSQIASAVMTAHAVEGIHLTLQVDTWPVAVDVALPTGLVVNEVLTNALKHAFTGRAGGNITVKSLVDDTGCRVLIADDGDGLPDNVVWPSRGKMSALIVQSLRENAKAEVKVRIRARTRNSCLYLLRSQERSASGRRICVVTANCAPDRAAFGGAPAPLIYQGFRSLAERTSHCSQGRYRSQATVFAST